MSSLQVCMCVFLEQLSDHHVYNVARSAGFSLELRPGLRVIPAGCLLKWGPLKSSIYLYMYIGILTIVPRDYIWFGGSRQTKKQMMLREVLESI